MPSLPLPACYFGKTYNYKGNDYYVVGVVSLKHPTSGDWVPAVVYQAVSLTVHQETYVREETDFLNKFKLSDIASRKEGVCNEL